MHALHLEALSWIIKQRETLDLAHHPLLVGLNGPQGAGKSTLCANWVNELSHRGFQAISISIDDFYLKRSDQVALGQTHPKNPLLQQRGYPGTHDVELGTSFLNRLKNEENFPISIPKYDKSAFEGKGDRMPERDWTAVPKKPDFIFLEGWLLGFPCATLTDLHYLPEGPEKNTLIEVNSLLQKYRAWNSVLDLWIQLIPESLESIVNWRVEAETKMKESGKPGMSTQEVTAYITSFLPAYKLYLPLLLDAPPLSEDKIKRLVINHKRTPMSSKNSFELLKKKYRETPVR